MADEREPNNHIIVSGRLEAPLVEEQKLMGRGHFWGMLLCERASGTIDRIPLLIPAELAAKIPESGKIQVCGSFRSKNEKRKGKRGRLILYVFVTELEEAKKPDKNQVELTGYLCKPVIYRKTPFGREISDLLLAVHRKDGTSDYLPAIAWRTTALSAACTPVGEKVRVIGRLQSREYTKRLEGKEKVRTAWELSISSFHVEGS